MYNKVFKNFFRASKNLQISLPSEYSRFLVDKGCICVDGCSLTVCDVGPDSFAIWLIPHTLDKTNLKGKEVGDSVNLEFDILAKYVEKLSFPIVDKGLG